MQGIYIYSLEHGVYEVKHNIIVHLDNFVIMIFY